jgi:hypothetical protein
MNQVYAQGGDVLLTYGTGGFWPPRRWVLWLVYRGIRAYQKAKWNDPAHKSKWNGLQPKADDGPTHVRLRLGNRWFEATTPRCRWTEDSELKLDKKRWKLVRFHSAEKLDFDAMLARAAELNGTDYDEGDLFDFAISGILGSWKKKIRILGDRARKAFVCSTAAREILTVGGVHFWEEAVDPAYYANNPREWWVVARSKK